MSTENGYDISFPVLAIYFPYIHIYVCVYIYMYACIYMYAYMCVYMMSLHCNYSTSLGNSRIYLGEMEFSSPLTSHSCKCLCNDT